MKWSYSAQQAATAIRKALLVPDQDEARRVYEAYVRNDERLVYTDRAYAHRQTRLINLGIDLQGGRVVTIY